MRAPVAIAYKYPSGAERRAASRTGRRKYNEIAVGSHWRGSNINARPRRRLPVGGRENDMTPT